MSIQRAVKSATKVAAHASRQINAVVVSSGLMEKTVKVRIGTQVWNQHLQKKFNATTHLLVHDPNSSLKTGDVISISRAGELRKQFIMSYPLSLHPLALPSRSDLQFQPRKNE
ncbi:hypothetical protein DID88_009979 [Monilinia fructigena]|uniref:Uncharacterized protein n=1 Tax=Monilinia fructigena TaxID=38457 RepID=A0A395IKJ0_9HELO|nr:hypothetical protein DID88_009979 [Monilinia fructigena]